MHLGTNRTSMSDQLTREQQRKLTKALINNFLLKIVLTHMLRFSIGKRLVDITYERSSEDKVFKIIEGVEFEGWSKNLIQSARKCSPRNPLKDRYFYFFWESPIESSVFLHSTWSNEKINSRLRTRKRIISFFLFKFGIILFFPSRD